MGATAQATPEEARRARVDPRLPIYVLTGARGSGKSTLITRIVRTAPSHTRYAVLYTDRASWARASAQGRAIAPDIVRSPSGAVCGFAGDDIVNAFYQLHLRKLGLLSPRLDFDGVLVELAAGLETESFTALAQNDVRLDATYRIARILCVVDVSRRRRLLMDVPARRIAEADTLVLSHGDRCSPDAVPAACADLGALNPFAAVVESGPYAPDADHAWCVPLGHLGESSARQLIRDGGLIRLSDPHRSAFCLVGNVHNNPRSNRPDDALPLRALRISLPGEVDVMMIMRVIEELRRSLGANVARLSAVLNVRHADYPIALEMVGGTLHGPSYASDRRCDGSDIIILAHGLDAKAAFRAFGRCSRQAAVAAGRIEVAA